MATKKYTVLGFDCPNCAQKTADKLEKLDGVNNAVINFTMQTMTVEYADDDCSAEQKCFELIKATEPDVELYEKGKEPKHEHHEHEHDHHHEHGEECRCGHKHHHEHGEECNCGHKHHHEHAHSHSHSHSHSHGEKKNIKKDLIISAVGVLLFLLTFIPNIPTVLSYILTYIGYILTAHEIILAVTKQRFGLDLLDENFLMLVASLGALLINERPEAFAVIIFYQIGEFCQDMAVDKSRKSITSLMNLRPDKVRIVKDGVETEVSPENAVVGDIMKIIPGEKIALDGIVTSGETTLDTSAITGESMPREIGVGNEILSGCINMNGVITAKITKPFGESTVSKILELVQNAGDKKAKAESFITKFARVYTPAVVVSAILLAVIGSIITHDVQSWIYRALTFLVVSCPCALVLSVPLGFFSAIGAGAKQGILIKGGNYLEALNSANAVLFDKTGTLTTGIFNVSDIIPAENVTKDELLLLAAIAESSSTHPIAKSIVNANKIKYDKQKITQYTEKTSLGVVAEYDNTTIITGSQKIMTDNNITVTAYDSAVVYVAANGKYMGAVLLEDEIKPDAKQTVDMLYESGIQKIVMLTGDNENAAYKVADKLGIDYRAGLLPQQKVEIAQEFSEKYNTVFVGDGMNDAPVLAAASIGMAMGGTGSDSAIEAADIVLMNDNPSLVCKSKIIAKKTRAVVMQNIVFALGIKLAILVLSAFGIAVMWEAVFADVGVALLAVLNSMRLLKAKY